MGGPVTPVLRVSYWEKGPGEVGIGLMKYRNVVLLCKGAQPKQTSLTMQPFGVCSDALCLDLSNV